jgi:hypothetical protein
MKRLLRLLGPIVAVLGSLGLFMTGGALVGVFDVFTYRVAEPPPATLEELPRAVMSAMAVVVGLVISCVATVLRDGRRTISTTGRLIHAGAGLFLIAATVPVVGVISQLKGSFRIISMSATAPTPEEIQELIQSAEPKVTIGAALLLVTAGLSAVAGLAGFPARASAPSGSRMAFRAMSAMGSVVVGAISLLLLISVWFHGHSLETMMADQAASPKPVELAEHLQAILNGTLLAFGGLATLGVLQILAAVAAPSPATQSVQTIEAVETGGGGMRRDQP